MTGLAVLLIDGDAPAWKLHHILTADPLVRSLRAATSTAAAFAELGTGRFDLVMLDVPMPGVDALDFARTLSRFAEPPAIVLVAADARRAAEAFDVGAVDFLVKPPTPERLHRALQRATRISPAPANARFEVVPVSLGGRTRLIARSDVMLAEAAGDYVRLHTRSGSAYLARLPLSVLERSWAEHRFARIHRSYLVALDDIREVRVDGAQAYVNVDGREIPVSRRRRRDLRALLSRSVRGDADAPFVPRRPFGDLKQPSVAPI